MNQIQLDVDFAQRRQQLGCLELEATLAGAVVMKRMYSITRRGRGIAVSVASTTDRQIADMENNMLSTPNLIT